ncbi:TetR family transcriptional regulator [Kineococcus sp. GCM10028916]|uniref:TetR family transcriptional regulator n=1 Tax=Kineococcus sp. GCM10028916 TaxID=3273394 RepID=UPI00362AA0F0
MSETAPPVGMRDRARRAMQTELAAVALELFLDQGYDETTVDQIAAATGMSQRTFFRYFPSKDAVLSRTMATTGEDMAAVLAARPAEETPWTALRHTFQWMAELSLARERSLDLSRMMLKVPEMNGQHVDKETNWRRSLSEILVSRLFSTSPDLPRDEAELRADTLAAAGMACLTVAMTQWVDSDGVQSLTDLIDSAMKAITDAQ